MFDSQLTALYGVDGAGKTYYGVRSAYDAYLSGSIIISNMWLSFPHIRVYTVDDLVPIMREIQAYHATNITPFYAPASFLLAHDIERIEDEEPRSFYILIDEGLMFLGKRNWEQNFKDPEMLQIISAPRHYDMQVTFIAKKITQLDKFIRELVLEIIEVRPFLFGLFRRLTSYDVETFYNFSGGGVNLNPDAIVVETKSKFDWLQKKKDKTDFFGGLYYTKEVLGQLAIRHASHITSLSSYWELEKNNELVDWQKKYHQKLGKDLLSIGKNLKSATEEVLKKEFSRSLPLPKK